MNYYNPFDDLDDLNDSSVINLLNRNSYEDDTLKETRDGLTIDTNGLLYTKKGNNSLLKIDTREDDCISNDSFLESLEKEDDFQNLRESLFSIQRETNDQILKLSHLSVNSQSERQSPQSFFKSSTKTKPSRSRLWKSESFSEKTKENVPSKECIDNCKYRYQQQLNTLKLRLEGQHGAIRELENRLHEKDQEIFRWKEKSMQKSRQAKAASSMIQRQPPIIVEKKSNDIETHKANLRLESRVAELNRQITSMKQREHRLREANASLHERMKDMERLNEKKTETINRQIDVITQLKKKTKKQRKLIKKYVPCTETLNGLPSAADLVNELEAVTMKHQQEIYDAKMVRSQIQECHSIIRNYNPKPIVEDHMYKVTDDFNRLKSKTWEKEANDIVFSNDQDNLNNHEIEKKVNDEDNSEWSSSENSDIDMKPQTPISQTKSIEETNSIQDIAHPLTVVVKKKVSPKPQISKSETKSNEKNPPTNSSPEVIKKKVFKNSEEKLRNMYARVYGRRI